jgi:hypothetical protein
MATKRWQPPTLTTGIAYRGERLAGLVHRRRHAHVCATLVRATRTRATLRAQRKLVKIEAQWA